MVIQIEHAGSVIKHISVDLAHRYNELQDMSGGMLGGDAICYEEGERAPAKLYIH